MLWFVMDGMFFLLLFLFLFLFFLLGIDFGFGLWLLDWGGLAN